jgi:hypothetical protein
MCGVGGEQPTRIRGYDNFCSVGNWNACAEPCPNQLGFKCELSLASSIGIS